MWILLAFDKNIMAQVRIFAEYLQIFLGLCTLVAIAYRFAKIEHRTYEAIDKVEDNFRERCSGIENRLALHIVECDTRSKTETYSLRYVVTRLQNLEKKLELALGESDENSH